MRKKTWQSSAAPATVRSTPKKGTSPGSGPGASPVGPTCAHDSTSLEWVTVPHPSGSPHLPGRERLAKVCQDCGKVVCFSHSVHTDLVLGLYQPVDWSPKR